MIADRLPAGQILSGPQAMAYAAAFEADKQRHLEDALRRLRVTTIERDAIAQELRDTAMELDLMRDHNRVLFALLLQRDRKVANVRAELEQLRAELEGANA